jgi:hypothetical protein
MGRSCRLELKYMGSVFRFPPQGTSIETTSALHLPQPHSHLPTRRAKYLFAFKDSGVVQNTPLMTTPRLRRHTCHHRTFVSDVSNSEMTLKSMFTSKTRLSDALRLGMKKSAFEKTPYTFLPQSALDSIIIEDTILMALGITKPTPEDCKLVAYILTKAKRLFATAAYVGLPSDTLYCAMVLFRNANFSDERLPLEEMGGEDFLKNKMNGLKHPLVKLEGHLKPNAERIWTFSRIHDFLKAQFSFLTPIFSTGKIDYDFGPSLILPFLKHTAQGEGSFGVVSRIEIHADHIKPTPKVRQ